MATATQTEIGRVEAAGSGPAWGCGRRLCARRRIAGGRVPAAPLSIGPRQGKSQLIWSAHAVASAGSGLRAIAARQSTRDDSRRHAGRPSSFQRSRQTSLPRKPAERAKPLVTMVIGAPLRNRTVDLLLTMETRRPRGHLRGRDTPGAARRGSRDRARPTGRAAPPRAAVRRSRAAPTDSTAA